MNELKVYTPQDVADLLKVTRRTVYEYITSKQLKATKRGKLWFITEENLKNFIDKQ